MSPQPSSIPCPYFVLSIPLFVSPYLFLLLVRPTLGPSVFTPPMFPTPLIPLPLLLSPATRRAFLPRGSASPWLRASSRPALAVRHPRPGPAACPPALAARTLLPPHACELLHSSQPARGVMCMRTNLWPSVTGTAGRAMRMRSSFSQHGWRAHAHAHCPLQSTAVLRADPCACAIPFAALRPQSSACALLPPPSARGNSAAQAQHGNAHPSGRSHPGPAAAQPGVPYACLLPLRVFPAFPRLY